jgi:site-specific recombinase XerD
MILPSTTEMKIIPGYYPPATMGELIDRCIAFDQKYKINSAVTRKTRKSRLTGNIKNIGTVEEIFQQVGVIDPSTLDRDKTLEFFEQLSSRISNKNYLTGIVQSVRHVLKFGMNEGYIKNDENMLNILQQKQAVNTYLKVPDKCELEVLEHRPLAKTPFLAIQMVFIISVLLIRLGLRSGKEVESLNVDDIDIRNRLLWVNRKRSRKRPISFGKDIVPILRYYRWIRYLYLKQFDATNETALIVKSNCDIYGCGKRGNWRLTAKGLDARWRNYRRKMGLTESRKLYDFRRLSVSVQCKVGRILGLAVSDLAFRNDHSREVFNKHYNVFVHDKSEFLTKDIDENIDYIKGFIKNSVETYQIDTARIEHLASAKRWFDTLGDFQNEKDADTRQGGVASNCDMGFHSTLKRFKKIARDLEKKSNIKNKQEKDIVVENRVKNGLTDANHGNTIPIKTDGIHLLNSMFSFST